MIFWEIKGKEPVSTLQKVLIIIIIGIIIITTLCIVSE